MFSVDLSEVRLKSCFVRIDVPQEYKSNLFSPENTFSLSKDPPNPGFHYQFPEDASNKTLETPSYAVPSNVSEFIVPEIVNSYSLGVTNIFFPNEDSQKEVIAHPSEVPRQSTSSSDTEITKKPSSTVPLKGRKFFNCYKCEKKFRSHNGLRFHMDKHTGKTTCQVCGTVLSRALALKRHLRDVHKQSNEETTDIKFTSDRCNNVFKSRITLRKRVVSKSRMTLRKNAKSLIGETTCKLCEKIFPTVSHLNLHVCSVQKQSQEETDKRTLICGRCKKVYNSRKALNKHLKSHAGLTTCKLCRKVFSSVCNLKRHLISVHRRISINRRKTDSCAPSNIHKPSKKKTEGRKASSQDSQKETKRRKASSQDSQFTCGVCKSTYKHDYNLKRHMRSHTGETTCKLCGKVLCRIDALKDHVRRVHRLFQ